MRVPCSGRGTNIGPRVLILASGSSIHTKRWANALALRGIDTHLVSMQPGLDSVDVRVAVHRPPFGRPFGYVLNSPWVRRLVRRISPDLIHAHYASGYGTMQALVDFHPSVVSVWGADIYEFPKRSRLHERLLRFNLSRADIVLSTSHIMARRAHELTVTPIRVTPFGVDLDRFTPSRIENAGEIVIGTVKTLEPKYGIEFLLRAFSRLRSRCTLPMRLLIVGGGCLEPELKRLAERLGIARETLFTGSVPHTSVPSYLNRMDIFVAPSIDDSESFGVAAVEASACALPVVVSDAGGLPEVVEHGVTGMVVPRGDDEALAAAIEDLVKSPELRRRMGVAGRERVRNLYDWHVNVGQMISIYEDVIAAWKNKT